MCSKRLLSACLVIFAGTTLAAQSYTFEKFAVQNSKAPNMGTTSQGSNNRGAVVGYIGFLVIDPKTHEPTPAFRGFKRFQGGAFEYPIIAPGDGQFFTIAEGIDDSGAIVGRYRDAAGVFHGFLLNNDTYTTIDEGGGPNTWVMGINNAGSFAGSFGVQTPPEHGFVSVNGVMTEFDVPGAPATLAWGIAHDGTIVGCTGFGTGDVAFVRGPQGHFLKFQAPNARTTCATGIDNASTTIVGYYVDQAFSYHGFVYDYAAAQPSADTDVATPPLVTVDYPGASATEVTGVDAQGKIVGWAQFIPSQGAEPEFGFIGTPVK